MKAFSFSQAPLTPDTYRAALADPAAGGYAAFEGWVRNHNEGHAVTRLEYEAFEALANTEGERIVAEAIAHSQSAILQCGSGSAHAIALRRSRRAATSSTK
jgi:molybdopterin synthase catalytic subunit